MNQRSQGEPDKTPIDVREKTNRSRRIRGRRLWLFRFITAVLIPTLLFSFVEMGLRVAGTGYPTPFLMPATERSGYLADNYKFAWRFFPRALARSPQPLMIQKQKPENVKRIIVYGSSAAMGDPEPAYGLARMLEVLLESRFPNQDFEVINAAMTAINSHVVLPIAKDCRQLNADAWVVYLGNNEVMGPFGAGTVFGGNGTPLWLIRSGLALNRTKTGQYLTELRNRSASSDVPKAWGDMEMFLGHQIRHDDPELDRVYDHYAANVDDLLNVANANRTPVVIGTMVSNLRSCAPFTSQHHPDLTEEQLLQWQSLYDTGVNAQSNQDFEAAIDAFEKAEAIDAEYAELQYRWAECLLGLGDSQAARARFEKARDYDTLRFRSSTEINNVIRAAAEKQGDQVALVDAHNEFCRQSPHGITGEELLCEHVHFTFSGNYLLAKLFAEPLIEKLELNVDSGNENDWPTEQQCAERLGFTLYHRLLFEQEMRGRLRSPPFDQQLHRETRDAAVDAKIAQLKRSLTPTAANDAVGRFQELIAQHPNDWVLKKQYSTLLESTGNVEEAANQWIAVTEWLPHHPDPFCRLGVLRNREKKWEEAEQSLKKAIELRPDYARAFNSLGIALSHQDQFDESYRQFARAIELQPSYAEAHMNWGKVLENQGDQQAAMKQYNAAIEAKPEYLPAHIHLGQYYSGQKEFDAAEPHYRALARLKPNDPMTHLNLGLLYLKLEKYTEAIAELESTLAIVPNQRVALQALSIARQKSR